MRIRVRMEGWPGAALGRVPQQGRQEVQMRKVSVLVRRQCQAEDARGEKAWDDDWHDACEG